MVLPVWPTHWQSQAMHACNCGACTLSKWKTKSNSQTFPKYRSKTSTKRWISSRMLSSLSFISTWNCQDPKPNVILIATIIAQWDEIALAPGNTTVSWSQNFNWHQKRGIQGNWWTLTFLPRCAKNEEHASIASINDLVASVLQEVCISGISSHYSPVDLRLDLELFHCIEGHIPLRQTGLTLPILEQDETNHRWYLKFGPPQTYIFEPHAAGYATAHMLSKVHKSTASLPLGVRKQITSQGPWYKTVWHSCPRLSCSTESCEAF